MPFNKLTPEEEYVIVSKGTEPAGKGEYNDFFEDGIYLCRRCDTPLYRSADKFNSRCGWPSFDQEIPGAVQRQSDQDGLRTEILCTTCGAHLGHVFEGEKLTAKNTRHCVNSLAMKFLPAKEIINKKEIAVFGAGCFWSVETLFKKLKGVLSVASGYAGGQKINPTYQEVTAGITGHAETVKIEFDPTIISYPALLDVFFSIHDPTTPNRQGDDIGQQYRSMVFYTSERQKDAASRFVEKLKKRNAFDRPIVTEVEPLKQFYDAETYHQNYYDKNVSHPYCQLVIDPKLSKFREKFLHLFRDEK